MERFYVERNFSKAEEILSALTPWGSEHPLQEFIFRGHNSDAFELIPSALRRDKKDVLWRASSWSMPIADQSEWEEYQQKAEFGALREFYRLADQRGLYVPNVEGIRDGLASFIDWKGVSKPWASWIPTDLLEAAALAQHYGIPTRLLDWTYDPFIALYFASTGMSGAKQICVWGLNHVTLMGDDRTVERLGVEFVTPSYWGNPNLAAQRGLFSHWPTRYLDAEGRIDRLRNNDVPLVDRLPLEARLKRHFAGREESRTILIRYRLPATEIPHLRKLLLDFNYGPARLFPGYDGVATEVLTRW